MQRCLEVNQLMGLRDVLLSHPLDRSDKVVREMVKKLTRVDKDIEKLIYADPFRVIHV